MQTNHTKRLAQLSPCLLLIILAFFLFNSSQKLNASADKQILNTAQHNAAFFQQEIAAKTARVTESFNALTTSPSFIDAWDKKDSMSLLHEINSISRFLERIGSAEQVVLKNSASQSIVNLSATKTRLPNALAENPGKGSALRLSEAGDLFLFSPVPFNGTYANGTLQIWQPADAKSMTGVSENDLWATMIPPTHNNSSTQATLLNQPKNSESDEWDVMIDRRQVNESPCLILKRDEHIYAGAAITTLTLYPSGETRGFVWLTDLTETLTPIYAASKRCVSSASALLLLAIIIGITRLKNCSCCMEHEKNIEVLQIERDGFINELKNTNILEEKLAAQLEENSQLNQHLNKQQARVNDLEYSNTELEKENKQLTEELDELTEDSNASIPTASQSLLLVEKRRLEAANAELQALADSLQAELDKCPPKNPADLDKAYTTISELKGLLEQCNRALTASQQELNKTLTTNEDLEQRLKAAQKM